MISLALRCSTSVRASTARFSSGSSRTGRMSYGPPLSMGRPQRRPLNGQQDRERTGRDHAGAHALYGPSDDDHRLVWRCAADERSHGEQGQPSGEDDPAGVDAPLRGNLGASDGGRRLNRPLRSLRALRSCSGSRLRGRSESAVRLRPWPPLTSVVASHSAKSPTAGFRRCPLAHGSPSSAVRYRRWIAREDQGRSPSAAVGNRTFGSYREPGFGCPMEPDRQLRLTRRGWSVRRDGPGELFRLCWDGARDRCRGGLPWLRRGRLRRTCAGGAPVADTDGGHQPDSRRRAARTRGVVSCVRRRTAGGLGPSSIQGPRPGKGVICVQVRRPEGVDRTRSSSGCRRRTGFPIPSPSRTAMLGAPDPAGQGVALNHRAATRKAHAAPGKRSRSAAARRGEATPTAQALRSIGTFDSSARGVRRRRQGKPRGALATGGTQ